MYCIHIYISSILEYTYMYNVPCIPTCVFIISYTDFVTFLSRFLLVHFFNNINCLLFKNIWATAFVICL